MPYHILIVEDEPMLYEDLRRELQSRRFSVDEYTKSYDEAIERIHRQTPDIVLLDVRIEGDKDGIELGKILNKKYNIPFMYVTDLNDETTFHQGLNTNHQQYIVKTKPDLNIDDVIRGIYTILKNKEVNNLNIQKNGVMGLVDTLENIKSYGKDQITKVPIPFEDIVYFTVNQFLNVNNELENVPDNYLWFKAKSKPKDVFFLKKSLRLIERDIPRYFVQINAKYIVNILPEVLNGRINGTRLLLLGETLEVTNTYMNEFKKRLKDFYH